MTIENIKTKESQIVFCTLALGAIYCNFAMYLARDLEKYSPERELLVLTDRPLFFKNQKNVLAFKYQPRSVHKFYDKIYAIEKALSLYESCIFLDSDVRILDDIPTNLDIPPGITADSCYSIYKLYENVFRNSDPAKKDKKWQLVCRVASKLNIDLDKVKFVWEYLFFIKRCSQTEEFIKLWRKIGNFYELNGRFGAEGEAMGLAAAKLNIPVNYDYAKQISFFKNRVELYKISQGKAHPEEKSTYLQKYHQIKYPPKNLVSKIIEKTQAKFGLFYRSFRLKLLSLMDFNFYYR